MKTLAPHRLLVATAIVALVVVCTPWRPMAAGPISGVVFEDFNGNGTRDTSNAVPSNGSGTTALAVDRGVSGVVVTVFDGAGAFQGSATTDASGAYIVAATGTGPYRVEFTGLPAGYLPSRYAPGPTGNGTTVQFVPDGATSDVNLGILDAANFCQNNPTFVTSCFVFGDQASGPFNADPVVVDFPYSAGGIGGALGPYDEPTTHGLMVPASQTGSVYGLAYRQSTNTIYAGAFMKKHAGFGSGGTGAIYAVNPTTGATSLFADLNAIFGAGTAGVDPHDPADYLRDNDNTAWDAVGKVGLGGLEISPDGSTVYVVNLADRQIYALPTSGPLTNATVRRVSIPLDAPGATGAGADLRPFALQWFRGRLYVGIVNSAESAGATTADLRAYVYTLDSASLTFGAAPVFQFALNYPRGNVQTFNGTGPAAWNRWASGFITQSPTGVGTYPQPWLAGLAFDVNGNMMIGLRDRAGDQFGFFALDNPGDPDLWEGVAGGDVLLAAVTTPGDLSSGWTLESNSQAGPFGPTAGAGNGQGPGSGELFFDDAYPGYHDEMASGAVLQLPGHPDVVTSAFNPGVALRSGGFMWLNPTTGVKSKGYKLYSTGFPSGSDGTFSKANGFGEIVALCQAAPIEVGNRVWDDVDGDGVQDADELGLDGVAVQLIAPGGAVVATVFTANGGQYYFSSGPGTNTGNAAYGLSALTASTAGFRLRVDPAQGALGGRTLTLANTDGSANGDSRDSDGVTTAGIAEVVFTTGAAGATNHTYDFGFTNVAPPSVSLGDLVWLDLNNNGVAEAGEPGVQGVTVRLIAANGTTVLATTTTDPLGLYLFPALAPGSYFVEVDRTSAPLTGYLSSTDIVSSANPDNNLNNDDNGVVVTATAVRSGQVTLTVGGEPVDDGDADASSNLSVDFGFVRTLSLGNLVWADTNDNGVVDGGEAGIGGVTVRLIAADGVSVLQTTTTNANGFYLFAGLVPATYFVEVVPPPGAVSSTDIVTSPTPNNDVDNDDNGVTVVGGAVRSGPITLAVGTEPTTDGDGNPDSNLTVDFGFVPAGTLSLGNLVWLDVNNNGRADVGEPGAPGVTVRLIAANGVTVLSTTTTDANGNYRFTSLPPGDYIVEVDRLSSAINGYLSSTDIATSGDPNTDVDNDDNGVNVTAAVVRSNPVTLSPLAEPIDDGDADPNSNLSIDFGFVRTVSLGNLVWVDRNNNALVDAGERGRAGVTVRLLAADCATVLATTLTDVNGNYLFSGLLPGTYCVSVVQPLGLQSSTDISSSGDPNNDRNNDDNGVVVSAGIVRSRPVTLTFGLEPVDDGDTNADSNLSVDFGFVPEEGGGFLADVCLGQTIPLSVVAGGQFTATYTADNRGPGVAENVVIDGMLPPGLSVVATAPSAGGTCTVTPTAVDCLWPGGTPAGVARSVVVTFQAAPTVAPGSLIWLWFMSHSANADPNPACDVTDSYVFVTDAAAAPVDLVITATGTSGTQAGDVLAAAVNTPVSARFTVTNAGTVPARGRYALLLDTANGIEVTSASATRGWLAVTGATSGAWETDLIPPGGAAELTIGFVPRTGTMWRIQAIRTEGAPSDPNAANDTAQVTIDGVGSGGGRAVSAGNFDGVAGHEIVAAAGQGETPQVRVFSGAGANLFRFFAFDPGFRGGVRVASCDIDGNGVDELIAAQGPGGGRVRVLSLAAGYVAETVAFEPFEAGFAGGLNVACGDVDGDGRAEVVVAPEGGRAPDVKVYAVGPLSAVVTAQFQAYEPAFTGGVRVSVGRFAGSGIVGAFNIATAPGPGRAVEARLWLAGGGAAALIANAPLYAGVTGARLTLGDVNGDGGLDLLVAPDGGAPMLLRAYALTTGAILLDAPAGTAGYRSVNVAIGTFGGAQELVVGRGPGEPPSVSTFRIGVGGAVTPRLSLMAFEVP